MKLADYMADQGVTPNDMAARLGCSEGAIRKWMYGERRPAPSWMPKIVEATDGKVQPNDFFALSPSTTAPTPAEAAE